MISTQRLPASLTPLDVALGALLDRLDPVAAEELPLTDALGCVAAEMPSLKPLPSHDVAARDGWALHARDLIGASSYSPLPLSAAPTWVEAGDPMPDGCDCIVDADAVDWAGPMHQVLAEALPGQGVRRVGGDVAGGNPLIAAGQSIRTRDLLIARAAGLTKLKARRPRLRVVNIPGHAVTSRLIADLARTAGVLAVAAETGGRDAASIAGALDADGVDLLMTIGGTGVGRTDATIMALAARGEVITHGIAMQPGRTCAIGKIGNTPVLALPGTPDQALAAWWALALPVLDRLSGRRRRQPVTLPLQRKIASDVGIAEIVLLARQHETWIPLATGDLPLDVIARAEAWLVVPGGAEGYAAGTPVDAYMLED